MKSPPSTRNPEVLEAYWKGWGDGYRTARYSVNYYWVWGVAMAGVVAWAWRGV